MNTQTRQEETKSEKKFCNEYESTEEVQTCLRGLSLKQRRVFKFHERRSEPLTNNACFVFLPQEETRQFNPFYTLITTVLRRVSDTEDTGLQNVKY